VPVCELGIDLEDAKLPERVGLGVTGGFAGVGGGSGSKILPKSSLERVVIFGGVEETVCAEGFVKSSIKKEFEGVSLTAGEDRKSENSSSSFASIDWGKDAAGWGTKNKSNTGWGVVRGGENLGKGGLRLLDPALGVP
jgi:hypothetical protein